METKVHTDTLSTTMAQTTVNQFFVTRKSNTPVHPSKKRKVDASDIELNTLKKKRPVRQSRSRTTQRRKEENLKKGASVQDETCLATPLAFTSKTPNTPEKTFQAINNVINNSPLGKVQVNEAINDQAKTILHSRGTALLQASLKGKAATSPAKVSEVLTSMSPKKIKEQPGDLEIIKDESEASSLQSRKDQLRKKYSNLLKDDAHSTAPSEAINAKSRRAQLRNKYKHLLTKEPTLGSDSSVSNLSSSPASSPIKSPEKAM